MFGQICKRRFEHIDDANRLDDNARQFREDGTGSIGPEEDLPAAHLALEDAGRGQLREFALRGAQTALRLARDFTQIEPVVRLAEQDAEDRLPGFAQQRGDRKHRIHNGYNCI